MKKRYGVLMQYFEWYLPPRCGLWNQLAKDAKHLSNIGITAVWMPPAYKGFKGDNEVGYGVYDLYDLGEFDQKNTVATKYGTKKEYLNAIKALQENGIEAYADIVVNQRMGADETEDVNVVETAAEDRYRVISEEEEILSWTKFTFPGRKGKYSDFTLNASHFSGIDYDERIGKTAIYNMSGHPWSADTDKENGTYDYLMGANVDFSNPEVVNHLKEWGQWYLKTTKVDGFRLDAVKHIDSDFFPEWLNELRSTNNRELFAVGEYWKNDVNILEQFLDKTNRCMTLFDVPLHYNLQKASTMNGDFDMSKILSGTLVERDPVAAVTFVDNHDTQPTQALDSHILSWFVMHAYALILLREEGYPCIFYGDYYGLEAREGQSFKKDIDKLLKLRQGSMTGIQHDYFDDFSVIGWSFEGETKAQGFAVIMTDRTGGTKRMEVGKAHTGQVFEDVLHNCEQDVVIDDEGFGEFVCIDGSLSVYAPAKKHSA